jgi:hypothetical protein
VWHDCQISSVLPDQFILYYHSRFTVHNYRISYITKYDFCSVKDLHMRNSYLVWGVGSIYFMIGNVKEYVRRQTFYNLRPNKYCCCSDNVPEGSIPCPFPPRVLAIYCLQYFIWSIGNIGMREVRIYWTASGKMDSTDYTVAVCDFAFTIFRYFSKVESEWTNICLSPHQWDSK